MSKVREKFEAFARELNDALVERETEIEIVCTALVAGEHVLFVGTPGEAKSSLLDSLVNWMDLPPGKKFSTTLNGQSVLAEILGPVAVSQIKLDKYTRNTSGKLPEAVLAFIDEPMRGNSAVRNATLRIMNERQIEKGDGTYMTVPLRMMVGGSNDWPKIEDEAEAYFDRWLFRKEVRRVTSSKGMSELLFGGDHVPKFSTSLNLEELDEAQEQAKKIPWSTEAKEALLHIVENLGKEGICPSSRRLVKARKAAQASAWLEGASEVDTEHLAILSHVLWTDPSKEYRTKCEAVVLKYANPSAARINARLAEMEQQLKKFKPGDLTSAQVAKAALEEILKELKKEKSAKAKLAIERVAAEIKTIKIKAIESVGS